MDAIGLLVNKNQREIDELNQLQSELHQERLEETDWLPKRERAKTYKTREIDKIQGTDTYIARRKKTVRVRLEMAADEMLRRAGYPELTGRRNK